ncbi:MAG: hypothetical protein F6K09_09495 [Merismopedia sp. SIO2A8]|nr:hypothetical protein [Merismopedia sp. SIO2A8]
MAQQWKWQSIYDTYLNTVRSLSNKPKHEAIAFDAAKAVRVAWKQKGMTLLSQQKNLMIQFRNRLKDDLPPGHVGLRALNLSTQEWTRANQATTQRMVDRNQQQLFLSPQEVNAIVTRATQTLLSQNWRELAVALAILTGRRMSEVIKTATFKRVSQYSVMFAGAVKRGGEVDSLCYEIPTLCLAEDAIHALQKIRDSMPTENLSVAQCNRFSKVLNDACGAFADLFPTPMGRDRLNFHSLRGGYAAIATFFYCPQYVAEAEFRAHIMGHFEKDDGRPLRERRSLTSDRYYLSYAIADDTGAIRKGIRLGWRGVTVLRAFQSMAEVTAESMAEPMEERSTEEQRTSTLEAISEVTMLNTMTEDLMMAHCSQRSEQIDIWHEDKLWLAALLDEHFPGKDWPDQMALFLDWVDNMLEEKEKKDALHITDPVTIHTQWLEARLEKQGRAFATLVDDVAALSQKMNNSMGYPELEARIKELEEENERLTLERDHIQAGLAQLQNSLETVGLSFSPPQPASAMDTMLDTPLQEMRAIASTSGECPIPTSITVPQDNERGDRSRPPINKLVDPDAIAAIRLIMDHNDATTLHRDKWRISTDPLRVLLAQVGKNTTPKIMEAMRAMKTQLDEHHKRHGLGQRHNRTHGGADKIGEIISMTTG